MTKRCLAFLVLLCAYLAEAQEAVLPTDFRQHNLTEYNSSFLSPIFSLDRNNPQSIALWSRWQWQSVDGDPTTLFLNYTRRLDLESVAGVGFFQHNTGTFVQTGGVVNYAYALDLESKAQIAFGLNLFGYQRKLANSEFQNNPNVGLPGPGEGNNFILQLAPSLRFKIDRFSIGIVAENLFDYNFSTKEKETRPTEKIYIGLASYSFPVTIFGSPDKSFLQPTLYMKTMPDLDNQFGFTTLFSTPKFWIQAGYNNFYGISGGLGGRFFRNFSLGALMEFGTSTDIDGTDPTFEIVTAYHLSPREDRKKVKEDETDPLEEIEEEITEDEKLKEELAKAEALAKEKQQLEEQARIEKEERVRDSIAVAKREDALVAERLKQQKTLDSITATKREEALAQAREIEAQKRQDSVAAVKKEEDLEVERLRQQKALDSIAAIRRGEALAAAKKLEAQKRQDSIAVVQRKEALAAERLKQQKTLDSITAAKKEEALAEARKIEAQRRQDSIAAVKREEALAEERLKQQKILDSIAAAKREEALVEARKIEVQKRQDSMRRVQEAKAEKIAVQEDEDKPKPGEKYEEVATEDGLELGYYLITNVFGTQKYFDAFMKDLRDRGLQPKSFYRSLNKYNYVYLERYDTMKEARKVRDSKFNGLYQDRIWIFRVAPKITN